MRQVKVLPLCLLLAVLLRTAQSTQTIASRVLEQMDEKVKPCDDFYKFACGNFVKHTTIPGDKDSVTRFSIIRDNLQKQLHLLVSKKDDAIKLKPLNLVKKLYNACMNTNEIEKHGLNSMINIMKKLGGWPVLGDKWDTKSEWTWTWAVGELRKLGYPIDIIITFAIGSNWKNTTFQSIYVDQVNLGLEREYLVEGFEDKVVKAYYEYMVNVAVTFGADRNRAKQELKESLEFEMKLAHISWPNEQRRNFKDLYNSIKLEDVQQKYPFINWVEFINALLPPSLSVNKNEVIVVGAQSYFDSLGQLLQGTPKRTIANYMMWRIIRYSVYLLTEELRKLRLAFDRVRTGQTAQKERWEECMDITCNRLPIAVGALYVRNYFQHDSKTAALEIVNQIRDEFETILNEAKWMDDITRQSALRKLKIMSTHIGYPDELMDDAKIEKYYENLDFSKITDNEYLSFILNINMFEKNYDFSQLREPVDKIDWVTHAQPAVINGIYSWDENSIQFTAAILQDHFFSADRPRYMNYGTFGCVAAHEITHAFDDKGRRHDLNGNVVDWWQTATENHYLEKAKGIIKQYGNYTEHSTGLNLNGTNTLGENIADNGGIKASYRAYLKTVSKYGPEQKLPGLKYSPKQMFWISAAQTHCAIFRREKMEHYIINAEYSPPEFRVLGPFRNRLQLAIDFECPEGSGMNPTEKYGVW